MKTKSIPLFSRPLGHWVHWVGCVNSGLLAIHWAALGALITACLVAAVAVAVAVNWVLECRIQRRERAFMDRMFERFMEDVKSGKGPRPRESETESVNQAFLAE